MSGLKLYTYLPNYRAWKTLIAAAYNEVAIEVPEFHLRKDNNTKEFRSKNPLGKVPVLDTPDGSLFESNAIARYVAGLRQDTNLLGYGYYEKALVDQWIDFSANELEPARAIWLYPILGFMQFDQDAYQSAKKDVQQALKVLNGHLASRTFLVGERITLADIVVCSALVDMYKMVFEPKFVKSYGNVTRWFNTLINQPNFAKVIGEVELCKKEAKATGGNAAPAGKKAKKPKPQAQASAKKTKKAKNPLDALPPTNIKLDPLKKEFFAAQKDGKLDEFWAGFWDKFDAEGWSFHEANYNYNDKNRVLFMTENLIGGWTQRLEPARKYAFGVANIIAANEDTPPFEITSMWLFRGKGVPAEFTNCPDTGSYTISPVDHTNPAERKRIELAFANKNEGKEVINYEWFR